MTIATGINLKTGDQELFDILNVAGQGTYLGQWDASTNTPFITNGIGADGDYYEVSVAGVVDFGQGEISFDVGDKVVCSGGVWNKGEKSLIDDNNISQTTTWSSSKIKDAIESGESADVFIYKGETDELPAEDNVKGNVWLLSTNGLPYWWDGENWVEFKQDLSNYYTKTETENVIEEKLEPVETKLETIEEGAEVNNIKSISVNDTEVVPDEDKNVNIVVPTKVSDIENDSEFITKNVDDLVNYYDTDTVDVIVSGIGQDIDKKQDEITENNKLDYSLLDNAPTKVSDFENDSEFITNTVGNLVNYYKKSETYTQQEINNLIAAVESFKIKVVDELPETDIDTHAIYFAPKNPRAVIKDSYNSYVYIDGAWELIGSTDIDLDNYFTKDETYSQNEVNAIIAEKTQDVSKYKTIDLYINGETGSDDNDGLTPETPAKTLAKISEYGAYRTKMTIWFMTDLSCDTMTRYAVSNKTELAIRVYGQDNPYTTDFSKNKVLTNIALDVYNHTKVTIYNIDFKGVWGSSSPSQYAISIQDSASAYIRKCRIIKTSGIDSSGYGVNFIRTGSVAFLDNQIDGVRYPVTANCSSVNMQGTSLLNTDYGIRVLYGGNVTYLNNDYVSKVNYGITSSNYTGTVTSADGDLYIVYTNTLRKMQRAATSAKNVYAISVPAASTTGTVNPNWYMKIGNIPTNQTSGTLQREFLVSTALETYLLKINPWYTVNNIDGLIKVNSVHQRTSTSKILTEVTGIMSSISDVGTFDVYLKFTMKNSASYIRITDLTALNYDTGITFEGIGNDATAYEGTTIANFFNNTTLGKVVVKDIALLDDDASETNSTYSSSKINSLVDLDTTKTSANLCIPTEDNTVRYYRLGSTATDIPLKQTMFIETAKYVDSENIRITQCAYVNYNTTDNPSFVRTAIGSSAGLTWTGWTQFATTSMLNKNSRSVAAASSSSQFLQLTLNIDAYTGGTIQFVSRTQAVYQIRFYRGDSEGIRMRCVAMNNIKAGAGQVVIKRKPVVENESSTVLYIKQPNYYTSYNYSVLGLEGTIIPSATKTMPSDAVDVPIYYIADSL